ncbi:Alpha/beta hydrolase fold-1 [Aspergillus karnatakaensis]|uniref:alpha/beta hydrolase n=1 Tax=Aspergillus karnatakaensis TaxID=1810916 RepID=UPI003CCE17DE
MPVKPTLIFAPGSWYPTSSFDPLTTLLNSHGYETHTVAFPSITQATTVKDLSSDIAAVRALVEPEVQKGRDVVVIAHSWAGLPVNSALEGLLKTDSHEQGKGGVVKLLFISAFIPEIGQSLVSAFGGEAEWYVKDSTGTTMTPSEPEELFFHDVPDASYWASTLRPAAWATTVAPATGAAYLDLPSTYLLCEEDRAIPLFVQDLMVEKATGNGADMRTESVKTGHTPWLVRTEWVAEWIRREVGEEI